MRLSFARLRVSAVALSVSLVGASPSIVLAQDTPTETTTETTTPAPTETTTDPATTAAVTPVEIPPSPADQEPPEYRFELGLGAGYHVFEIKHGLGRAKGDPTWFSPKHNLTLAGRLTYNFNRWVGLEAEAYLIPTRNREVRGAEETDIWVFGGRGHVIVNFIDRGPFRPFILAGAGSMTSVVDDESFGIRSDTDWMLHGGLGFKLFFTPRFGLRADARGMVPPAAFSDIASIGQETGFNGPDWEFLGSLFFAFGEVPRGTREVVVVNQPAPAAPVNPDPDGDGVANEADKCPNVAEDRDGFEDEDGCPEADNDGDGIPDAADKCANQAETKNGIDDEDGCPETDTDGDGIFGTRDKCPEQPETRNGFQDTDGCPDELPDAVKKFTGVIQGINFKTNSADLLRNSFPVLDRAVAVLKEYPELRLEISGHTDNRGKADYNRDLSQRRSESVKQYMVSRGIAAERLEAVGYGIDRPIADNKTKRGRSKNRRTEFRILTDDRAGTTGTPPGGAALPGTPATPAAPAAPARPATPAPAAPTP